MDISIAVFYVNRGGGTRSKSLSHFSGQISSWCESRDLAIYAEYLSGHLNVIADRESRTRPGSSDWALNQVFATLNDEWECQVDLFSAAWNSKFPKFHSWTTQPRAAGMNRSLLPFRSTSKELAKIRRSERRWFS